MLFEDFVVSYQFLYAGLYFPVHLERRIFLSGNKVEEKFRIVLGDLFRLTSFCEEVVLLMFLFFFVT